MNYLRNCAGCAGSFLGYAAKTFDEPYLCPKCYAKTRASFDPKLNDIVQLRSRRGRFVILAAEGDHFKVRRLGLPESPTVSTARWELQPVGTSR